MKPTLDEEITEIAKDVAIRARCKGFDATKQVKSSIYAGIEAWKRQKPEFGLSNSELATAIERAQALTRNAATGEVIYKSWVAHLEALLNVQRVRAMMSASTKECNDKS